LGLHKWEDYGEAVLIEWKEPGFVPGTTEKIKKYVHSQRKCSRCGTMEKRIFADNADGTTAAIGWEKTTEKTQNSTD
jgi:hypothetical protein